LTKLGDSIVTRLTALPKVISGHYVRPQVLTDNNEAPASRTIGRAIPEKIAF
jgi:hypothetical protein